jgi:hypothetical protein
LFFYDKIFEEQPVNSVNWKSIKLEYFSAREDIAWLKMLLPLLLLAIVFFGTAARNLKRLHTD